MPKGELRVLECLLCRTKHSRQDAIKRRYFPETKICKNCYRKGQKTDSKIWCFGKVQTSTTKGYSSGNEICQRICPDRDVCKFFTIKLREK